MKNDEKERKNNEKWWKYNKTMKQRNKIHAMEGFQMNNFWGAMSRQGLEKMYFWAYQSSKITLNNWKALKKTMTHDEREKKQGNMMKKREKNKEAWW